MKEVVFSKEAPAAVGPYSHAIDCGNLVFLSGQVPLVPETGALAEGGIEGQARWRPSASASSKEEFPCL